MSVKFSEPVFYEFEFENENEKENIWYNYSDYYFFLKDFSEEVKSLMDIYPGLTKHSARKIITQNISADEFNLILQVEWEKDFDDEEESLFF